MKISYLEKLRFQDSKAIVLVKSIHASGADIFVYIKVDRQGYEKLLKAYESQIGGKFSDYGDIILFGKGEPNEETKKYIKSLTN